MRVKERKKKVGLSYFEGISWLRMIFDTGIKIMDITIIEFFIIIFTWFSDRQTTEYKLYILPKY